MNAVLQNICLSRTIKSCLCCTVHGCKGRAIYRPKQYNFVSFSVIAGFTSMQHGGIVWHFRRELKCTRAKIQVCKYVSHMCALYFLLK